MLFAPRKGPPTERIPRYGAGWRVTKNQLEFRTIDLLENAVATSHSRKIDCCDASVTRDGANAYSVGQCPSRLTSGQGYETTVGFFFIYS